MPLDADGARRPRAAVASRGPARECVAEEGGARPAYQLSQFRALGGGEDQGTDPPPVRAARGGQVLPRLRGLRLAGSVGGLQGRQAGGDDVVLRDLELLHSPPTAGMGAATSASRMDGDRQAAGAARSGLSSEASRCSTSSSRRRSADPGSGGGWRGPRHGSEQFGSWRRRPGRVARGRRAPQLHLPRLQRQAQGAHSR